MLRHVNNGRANIQTYDRFQATFRSHKTLSLAFRIYNLKQLAYLLQDNVERFQAALALDLQKKPFDVELSEVS